jgi:hypothetical protein
MDKAILHDADATAQGQGHQRQDGAGIKGSMEYQL